MKVKFKTLSIVTIAAITSFSCNDDDDNTVNIVDNSELFQEVQTTIGGSTLLNSASFLSYESVGIAYEFQENPEPIGGKVADFDYSLLYNLDGSQSRQAWDVNADYAYATDFSFTETIDGTKANSVGKTGTFSVYFESFGVTGDPMYSTKLASRQKTLMMSSPIAIMKLIDKNTNVTGSTYGTIDIQYNTSSLGFGENTPDIQLVIDTNTKLPSKAQTLENDPLLGDVLYEVIYSNWTTIDGLQVPQTLEHILDGNTIRTESLTNISINPTFDSSELTVTDSYPYDATQAEYGYLSSQLHFRTIMQTFPLDFPVEFVDSQNGINSEVLPNDPNAYVVAGDAQSHYTYAFKVDGNLVLYDSPINDRRSAIVLEKIRKDFSTDPIEYVVNSHNHFDHIGGTRGNLAEGGDLIVGAGSQAFMQEILNRPSTVVSNPIEGKSINVIGLSTPMTIGSGDEELQLHIITTEHAEEEDYVIIYKPSTKTLFFNDLVNPGFVFMFDIFSPEDKTRTVEMAKEVVDFVDSNNLDVTTYYCTHGFITQDHDFQTVRDLATR
ncbi:hypothetical protein UJ101_01753 [Flavobacteriaceae bacterium UJ101]|nr:hypothetical protein UJ101_01753 [Flavobacteriaceae bacterium UJ101]